MGKQTNYSTNCCSSFFRVQDECVNVASVYKSSGMKWFFFFCTFSQVGNMQEAHSQLHLSSFLPSPQPLYQPTVYTAATRNVNFPLGESLLTLPSAASSSVSACFLTDTHTHTKSIRVSRVLYLHLLNKTHPNSHTTHTHTHSALILQWSEPYFLPGFPPTEWIIEAPRNAELHRSVWVGLRDPPPILDPLRSASIYTHNNLSAALDFISFLSFSPSISARALCVCVSLPSSGSVGRSKSAAPTKTPTPPPSPSVLRVITPLLSYFSLRLRRS